MKKLFLSLLFVLLPLVASAHDFEVDGIYYSITDNEKLTVEVTYRGTSASSFKNEYSSNVVIPETVTFDSKTYNVTSIRDGAFYNCDISMLTVGANVLSIGDNQSTPTKTIWLTKTTPNGYKNLSGKINYVPNEQYTSFSNKQVSKYLNAIFEVDGMTFIPINPSERTCDLIDYNSSLSASTVTVEKTVSFKNVAMTVKNIMPYTFYNNKTIKRITIKNEGNIGDYAFYGCKNLNSVTMDDNVTGIGYNSFENCTSLASIVIPNSVTDIGDYAFSGCTNISSATIGNSVTIIGDYAFYGCTKLIFVVNNSKLNITSGSENHGYVAYYANRVLSGEYIDNINNFYFKESEGKPILIGYAGNETNITLPDSYKGKEYSIGDSAFWKCKQLESVAISSGVTSIGQKTFYDCRNLKSVTIPNSVTSIGDDAFHMCLGLTSVHISDIAAWCNIKFGYRTANPLNYAEHLYMDGKEIKDLEIPNSVTSINTYAFCGCSGLTSVTIPNSITEIGTYAFQRCSGLTSVTIPNSVKIIQYGAFSDCSGLTSISIPNSVTSIGEYAFSGCSGLTSVTIPNSITSIDKQTFSNCSGLTSINIPNNITEIRYDAFQGCSGLTSVTIPNSVKSIWQGAFSSCSGLESIIVDGGNSTYDSRDNCNAIINTKTNELIAGCKNTSIPNGITDIASYAFSGCSGLTSVTIPNSVTKIGWNAFYGCSGLTSVALPNSLTYINDCTFSNCSSLTYIIIPDGVEAIGYEAFYGCYSMRHIYLGKNLKFITDGAFYDCSELKTVINNSSLNIEPHSSDHGNVGFYADEIIEGEFELLDNFIFKEYGDLIYYLGNETNVTLPDAGRTYNIDKDAFKNCSLSYVTIPNCVSGINARAFYGCKNLKSIVIPSSINYIDEEAFRECRDLKTVINKSDINITKGSTDNGYVARYASKVYTGKDYDLLNGFIFNKLKREYFLIDYIDNKNEVTLPDNYKGGTYGLGEKAFLGHSYLTSINLPNCITSIGNEAFSGCSGLTSISIPNSVTSIGEKAFSGCSGLTSISIPNSVVSIGDGTFSGCNKIANVTIEERENSLTLGSNGANPFFSDCPLDTVYIGGKIIYNSSSSYGYSPFYKNTSLQTLIVGDKEDEIYANEFYGCTNLKNVQIGDGVKSIGDWAFSGCSNLDYFAFGTGLQSIGKEAFSDCVNVTKLISYAVAPPKCGEMALDDINKWNCTLQIPQQSLAAYQAADQWKEFFFIEGFDATGIEGVTADNPSLNAKANVYTLDGTLIKGNANISNLSNELPKGIYIVNGKKFYVK